MKKVVAILITAMAIAWCVYSANKDHAVQVKTSTVQKGRMELCVEGDGEIAAKDSFVAVMPIAGKIDRVNVTEGQEVLSNSVLFSIDVSSQTVGSSLSQQASAQAGTSETAKNVYTQAIEQAQGNGISYDAYMSILDQVREQLAEATSADTITPQYAGQQGKIDVTSGISGKVLSVNISQGSYAEAGATAICVGSDNRVVRVWLFEKDFVRVQEGQKVKVEIGKQGTTAEGIVESKSQTLKKVNEVMDPVGEIVIALDEKDIAEVGSSARVSIEYDRVEDTVLIPVDSLVKENDTQFVFVMENGLAGKRRIKTGLTDGEKIQVLEGVLEGETVIVNPPEELKNGERVATVD